MKKITTIKRISLSTVLISLLAGCGGGGGGGSSSSSPQGGVSTTNSCVDVNQNGQCESSESSAQSSSYPNTPLASKSGQYFTAPAGSSTLSAWSTLVNNEMLYNPVVAGNKAEAELYLKAKFNKDSSVAGEDVLTTQQKSDYEASLKQAIEANPLVHRSSITAAVSEKFLSAKSKVTVNVADIAQQTMVLSELKLTKISDSDWARSVNADLVGEIRGLTDERIVKAQGGERIVQLRGKGDFLVASSQYHNALTVIDLNEGSSYDTKYNKFAAFRIDFTTGSARGGTYTPSSSTGSGSGDISGGGTGGSTGGISGGSGGSAPAFKGSAYASAQVSQAASASGTGMPTGATFGDGKAFDHENRDGKWEHLLTDAQITPDGKHVYALIRSKNEAIKYSDETTFGFYRVEVGAHGVGAYNATSTTRLDSRDISSFKLSNNDERVFAYGKTSEDKYILRAYSADLTQVLKAVEVNKLTDFALTQDDKTVVGIIAGSYTEKPQVVKFDSTTLTKETKTAELGFEPEEIFTFASGTLAIATSAKFNQMATINLESMQVLETKTLDFAATHFSVSPHARYLAVGSKDKINIYNLLTPKMALQNFIELDATHEELNYMNFVGEKTLSYAQKKRPNAVVSYRLTDTLKPLTSSDQLKNALSTLTKASVNHGFEWSKVSKNLNLIASYKGVNFAWSVNDALKNNLNASTGAVTRTNADVNGVLSVVATSTFRGESQTKSKDFNLTVLQAVPSFTDGAQSFNQLNALDLPGIAKYAFSNEDGSITLSYTELDDYFKGYHVYKVENNKLVFTDGNVNQTRRLYRDSLLGGVFKDDNTMIIATVNRHYPSFSSLYVQDVLANGTLEESYNTKANGSVGIGHAGTPLAVGFSGDKTKVFVMRKHYDFDHGDFYADVYQNSGTKFTKEKSIRLKKGVAYLNTSAPAVNNDGSAFYQRAENMIYKHVDSDTEPTTVRLDGVEALYYFNNRVYATTTNGEVVSFNANLEESSKKEFNTGVEASIANLVLRNVGGNNYLYAFAKGSSKGGVYIMQVDDQGNMSQHKYSLKANTAGGTVSGDGAHIFTYENVPYKSYQSTKSSISYAQTN